MIDRKGKRVKFSDGEKKKAKDDADTEVAKHSGKALKDLTDKEKDDLLIALGVVKKNGKIK